MAFHFVTGLMGGGKSYYGAELCFHALTEGAVIHTNVPLNQEIIDAKGWQDRVVMLDGEPSDWVRIEERNGKEVWVSDLLYMGSEGSENIVVVDEAAISVSAETQTKDAAKNRALFGLIALSRHAGLEVYFLAQRQNHVAKKVRDLAETVTFCVNCAKIPAIGWFLVRFFGDMRRTIKRDGVVFGSYFLRRKQEICDFYSTHGMRDKLDMKQAGHRVKRASAWTSKSVWQIVGVALLAVGAIGFGLFDLFDTLGGLGTKSETPASEAATKTTKTEAADKPATNRKRHVEWSADDEHVIGAVFKGPKLAVLTRSGYRLQVGSPYDGDVIYSYHLLGDYYYFICVSGRVVVARPLRIAEREKLPPLTIPGQNKKADPAIEQATAKVADVFGVTE